MTWVDWVASHSGCVRRPDLWLLCVVRAYVFARVSVLGVLDVQGYSNPLYNVTVVSTEQWERNHDRHVIEWTLLAALAAATVGAPLAAWLNFQLHFDAGVPKHMLAKKQA